MLDALDASALRRWCAVGLAALTAARQEIDDLNVYPVPDGDTGTNLQLTMAAVAEAVDAAPPDMAATVEALVSSSLVGARGNSGVILSQLLRGFGEVLARLERCGPDDLRHALARSVEAAYSAVGSPVEGTVLTVARDAAWAAAASGSTLVDVVEAACAGADQSLAQTPRLLPQLEAAGVVDAGGRGWCVLLHALLDVVTGRENLAVPVAHLAGPRPGLTGRREAGSDEYAYEVQYLLAGAGPAEVGVLRTRLGELGDSLVLAGSDGLHHVHVHVNDVGAAIEAGIDAGRPSRLSVTRFEDQQPTLPPVMNERPAGRRVVAVAAGAGLARAFGEAGCAVVVRGTEPPSAATLLEAVLATGAGEVLLMPNDRKGHVPAAAAAESAASSGVTVRIVPTDCALQGLAAVSVRDDDRPLDDDLAAQLAAVEGMRWGEVGPSPDRGGCPAGEVLGTLDGAVVEVGSAIEEVARALLERLLAPGGELVTLVTGTALTGADLAALTRWLQDVHGFEPVVVEGGFPHPVLLLGVE